MFMYVFGTLMTN